MNQRISPRKALQTSVIFEDEFSEGFLYFVSSNISTSGLFIQTDLGLKPGTRVFLKFSLDVGAEPIHVAAEVMRLSAKRRGPGRRKAFTPGLGLRFLGLSSADFQKIETLIGG